MSRVLLVCLLLLLPLSGIASDSVNTYISLNGNFYFSYPADWNQLDYMLLDIYLDKSGAGDQLFEYEAGFCPKNSAPFYQGPYFILTVESDGAFSEQQIDSVLKTLQQSFGEGIKYYPVSNFLADLKSNTPVYDEDRKVVTILSDIVDRGVLLKKHLLMMKFFEQGLATFYFYSPDSLFEQSKQVLNQVIESFTYGNIDAVMPKEKLEVADIGDVAANDKDKRTTPNWLLYPVLAAILIVLIIAAKKRKKRNQSK